MVLGLWAGLLPVAAGALHAEDELPTASKDLFSFQGYDLSLRRGGPLDASDLLDRPAGKDGWLKGGAFADGKKAAFLSLALKGAANGPSHDQAEALAEGLAQMGVNRLEQGLVRFFKATTWDAAQVERLDYFVYQLQKRGIYEVFDLVGNDEAGPSQRDLIRQFLHHKNPYTDKRYAEDPAVAGLRAPQDLARRMGYQGPLSDAGDHRPDLGPDDLQLLGVEPGRVALYSAAARGLTQGGEAQAQMILSSLTRARWQIDSPMLQGWAGAAGQGGALSGLTVTVKAGYMALVAASLDGKPLDQSFKVLLTLWGGQPIALSLRVTGPRQGKVWQLGVSGQRLRSVPAQFSGGQLSFEGGAEGPAVCYELALDESAP
jgi:hypothetical protein